MQNIKNFGLSIVVASALSFVGCGGGSSTALLDSTSSTKITGDVTGNGYASNDIINKILDKLTTKAYAIGVDSPDKIVVMYDYGKKQKEFDINPDGSFEVDTNLFDKNDLIALVVNSNTKKVYGHLNLGTSTDAKLDFIDKSKLSKDLDLGSIDTENNCSSEETISSSSAFADGDLKDLEKIAIADDALVLYQNKYKNPDYESFLDADFILGTLSSIKDTYYPLNNFSQNNFKGVKPTVETILEKWIGKTKSQIKLYPPSDVNYTMDAFSDNPTYQTATPAVGVYAIQDQHTASDYNFFDFPHFSNYPEGDWLLKDENGQVVATFSYTGANPFNGNNIKIPIPKIKLNMNGDIINSITIQWYIYNGNEYVEANDDIMNSIASQRFKDKITRGIFGYFQNYTGNQVVGLVYEENKWNGTFYIYDEDKTAKVTSLKISTTDLNQTDELVLSYYIGGVRYKFMFLE